MSGTPMASPRLLALKMGTRSAIEAAGGLEYCETETRAKKSQLSRCQSRNHDDLVSIGDAATLDALGMGRGGPHILRALARQLGCAVIVLPDAEADETGVARGFCAVIAEMGDVGRKVDDALRDGAFEPHEAQGVLHEIDELIEGACAFRQLVHGFAWPGRAPTPPASEG